MTYKLPNMTPDKNWGSAANGRTEPVNWRRELLYLGLAAMETCWFSPWLALIIGAGYKTQPIPFVAILSTLLLGMYLTRSLNRRAISLQSQRIFTILAAVLSSLLLLRLYVYVNYSWGDLSWLGYFAWQISNIFQTIPPTVVIFFASLYLWVRGVHLAQRDLSVESLGFSFRVGIIAFLWFFLVRLFGTPVEAIPYTFLYFFLGLFVVGLGRIESVSQSHLGIRSPFTASWMAILIGSTLIVSVWSILLAYLFSLRNISTAINHLRPVILLLGKIAYPLLAIMALLLEFLINSLIRLFSGFFGATSQESSPFIRIAEGLQRFQQPEPAQGVLLWMLQILKWGSISLIFIAALAMLALSVGRVRQVLRDGRSVQHESVGEADSAAKDVHAAVENHWRKLLEGLQARLALLRREEYALATIRQIYGSLVKLATVSGFPRHEAQTPYEYAATLHRAFPGSEREIRLITEAYVRAHYGQRSFPSRYVQRVRDAWLAIRMRQEQERSGIQYPGP